MSDTTRRAAPDERVPPALASLPHATTPVKSTIVDSPHTSHETYNVTNNTAPLPIDHIGPPPTAQVSPRSHTLPDLVDALDTGDHLIVTMVAALHDIWSEVNNKGTTITKIKSEQLIWGHTRNQTESKTYNNKLAQPIPLHILT